MFLFVLFVFIHILNVAVLYLYGMGLIPVL